MVHLISFTIGLSHLSIHDRIKNRCEEALIGNFWNRKDLKTCEKIADSKHITIHNYINRN